jgi:hypothetical protein
MLFELYDPSHENRELHLEMTEREARIRNQDLQEKGDSQRWVICTCPSFGETETVLPELEPYSRRRR